MRVGNGRSCRFWTDNWSPFGSFESYLLRGTASRSGISRTATLSELCVEGQWALPPARSDEFLQVYTFLTTVELREEEDRYEWCVTDAPTNRSSTGDVYRKLKPEEKEVPWTKVVWIRGGIPKHSFLTWLFMRSSPALGASKLTRHAFCVIVRLNHAITFYFNVLMLGICSNKF
uniref:Reverse transcriptase zinc-binding domain-containing protein n=1 Tax=Brassica oleracea TaxID=3712 RepID=A0A3P6AE30_BRAOL|nr:unnamed protein product [Brassica oleracea]